MSTSATTSPLPPITNNAAKTPTPIKNTSMNNSKKQAHHIRQNQLLMANNNNNTNAAAASLNTNNSNTLSSLGGVSGADPKLARFYQPFHSYILNPSSTVKEEAKRTHPKGFRYRVMSSPLERNMNSYFRLPTEPPKRAVAEFSGVHQLALKAESRRMKEIQRAKPINGFALLKAADDAEDPSAVVEVSLCGKNFGSVVVEDLSFFTNLRVLDAGDNESLTLHQFTTLPALEELHLHCNMLTSISMPPSSSSSSSMMMLLHTLNVAFNRLTRRDFIVIGKSCPMLQRLDFSHNILGNLNRDEDQLGITFGRLTQLAIENNELTDGTSIFSALCEIPHLQELNCNNNKFEAVSLLPPPKQIQHQNHQQDENNEEENKNHNHNHQYYVPTIPFPALNTLGLAHNAIASIEAIAALSRFPSLRRVILWGNPLQRQRRFESDLVAVEFESIGVQALMQEPGKMGRAKVGKFYNKNDCPYFAVEATEGSGLPRQRGDGRKTTSKKNNTTLLNNNNSSIIAHNTMMTGNEQQDASNKQHQESSHKNVDDEELLSNNNNNQNNTNLDDDYENDENNNESSGAGATGPSFFMTEGDDTHENSRGRKNASTSKRQQQQQQQQQQNNNTQNQMSPANAMTRENPNIRNRVQANAIGAGILPSTFGQPMRSISANEKYQTLDPIVEGGGGETAGIGKLLTESSGDRKQNNLNNNHMLYGGSSAGATLRSVVGDLRRALRQPLPPLPL